MYLLDPFQFSGQNDRLLTMYTLHFSPYCLSKVEEATLYFSLWEDGLQSRPVSKSASIYRTLSIFFLVPDDYQQLI